MVLFLCVAVIASVTTLWLRGFKVSDLTKTETQITTPTLQAWVIKNGNYATKMDAYKDALLHAESGFGIHVIAFENEWEWIGGVYGDQAAALNDLADQSLPGSTKCVKYEICDCQFNVTPAVAPIAQEILNAIEQIYQTLSAMRDAAKQGESGQNQLITLTELLNVLRVNVNALQDQNINLKEPVITALIYSANQNVMALHDLIFSDATGKAYLSLINTAMLKSIFSLDNF